jgi:hypothetical protein
MNRTKANFLHAHAGREPIQTITYSHGRCMIGLFLPSRPLFVCVYIYKGKKKREKEVEDEHALALYSVW